VPISAQQCAFCGSALELRAAVDITNGQSIRGRITRVDQRCAANCERGQEWTTRPVPRRDADASN
jgi:hypothetical protein